MDATEILLRLIGAFYIFAGWVATRAALTARLLDQALGAISGRKPQRIEAAQTAWFLVQAHLVLASGLALALLSGLAPWFFLAAAAGQALYLMVLAPRHFDPVDPPEAKGRQQTINAFLFYAAATALVMWAWHRSLLHDTAQLPRPVMYTALAAFALHAAWAVRTAIRPLTRPASAWTSPDDELPAVTDPVERARKATRVRVLADYQTAPLWALDDGLYGDIRPEDLGLSDALVRDLWAWAEHYTASFDGDPLMSRWTDAQYDAHAVAAHPLARRLAQERPDLTVYVASHDGREVPITELAAA